MRSTHPECCVSHVPTDLSSKQASNAVFAMMSANEAIKSLEFTSCQVNDTFVTRLSEVLPTSSLVELGLWRNSITAAGINPLCQSLEKSKLLALDLRENQLGVAGSALLGEALASNHTLQRIDVRSAFFSCVPMPSDCVLID